MSRYTLLVIGMLAAALAALLALPVGVGFAEEHIHSYCVSGTSNGVTFSYTIQGMNLPTVGETSISLPNGSTADQFAARFVAGINKLHTWPKLTAAQVDETGCFRVSWSGSGDFSLSVTGPPPYNWCNVDTTPAPGCAFNPNVMITATSVGGVAELPALAGASGNEEASAPAGGSGWSAGAYAALAAGLAAAAMVLSAGTWYARRRWLR